MNLNELDKLLDHIPVVARMHPVSLALLDRPVILYKSADEMAFTLDALATTTPGRWLTLDADTRYLSRFPEVTCEHDPFTPELNRVLFPQFDHIAQAMFCQSQIAERIEAECGNTDVIGLMVVDGLSFGNCKDHPGAEQLHIEACLVDGPTVTRIAYLNAIGGLDERRTIAERLFDKGYNRRLGFTYWEREDNTLTNRIFKTFRHLKKATDFSDVLDAIRRDGASPRTYIQIVRTALDGYAHRQKRKPPIVALVGDVLSEFFNLGNILDSMGRRAKLYLTADHGLLWKNEFEPKIVGRGNPTVSARYCEGVRGLIDQVESGKSFHCEGQAYYCLDYPKVSRALRTDEQGVHGGVSFQESIVPFITLEID